VNPVKPRNRGLSYLGALGLLSSVVALFLTFSLGACGGAATTTTLLGASATGPNATSTVSGARAVAFVTDDGVPLSGHLFGSGSSGVVVCHMYPADQSSWYATARTLASEGYVVLTFDFRGYGGSGGEKQIQYLDRDVLAAIREIAQAGATKVALVGASMGGTASLMAAHNILAEPSASTAAWPTLVGVATLSAPVSFQGLAAQDAVPGLTCPLLFIAAEKDVGADGARALEQLSGGTADLEIMPGADHGTNLLAGSNAARVMELLSTFLKNAFR
jgi:pimeloyl-ACP methyl ester carboxylesterase